MGNNTKVLASLISFFLAIVLAFAQFEQPGPSGKPCTSSFHCWRTEPINEFGEPAILDNKRRKRLEVGSSFGKGGKCRCIQRFCSLFHQPTATFVPCEEF